METRHKITEKLIKIITLLPIIIAMGVIPVIVRVYEERIPETRFEWEWKYRNPDIDLFLHYKMVTAVIIGIVSLVLLLLLVTLGHKKNNLSKTMILLVGFVGLVLISFLRCDYKDFATYGAYFLTETTWVTISYVVICIYAAVAVDSEEDISIIFTGSFIFVAFEAVMGVLQYFGVDFFAMDWYMRLIMDGPLYEANKSGLGRFFFNRSYGTLYNPDYMAMYAGPLAAVFISLAFYCKKIVPRIISIALSLALVFMVWGADVSSGLIAVVLGALIAVSVILWKNKKLRVGVLSIWGAMVVAFIVFMTIPATAGIRGVIFGVEKYRETDEFISIVTGMDGAKLRFHNGTIKITGDTERIEFSDKDNVYPYEYDKANKVYVVDLDDKYPEITFSPIIEDMDGVEVYKIVLHILGKDWTITNSLGDGMWCYRNEFENWVVAYEPESIELFNDEAFSGRGRIWNRAIPLLKDKFFVGSGANTFQVEYPQNDYVYKAFHSLQWIIDVKAHNWFLHMMIEEGILSVLLFLAFYIIYFVNTIRLYFKADNKDRFTFVMMGFWAATLIYMIAAMANDSTVNTATVYWAILGIGIASNRIVAARIKSAEDAAAEARYAAKKLAEQEKRKNRKAVR